ncbi:MAG TPA: MarR family winged helix-turn-helix transcriptional regulator [Solirubrobacterales bacterium]|jgi:DNA-binding MarR family transcriptional regulator
MTKDPQAPPPYVALHALWDAAQDAFFAEFRDELEQTEYSDVRPTHGCVFRFVREDGMRLTRLAELAKITKQSAGEVIDDLVKRGYVERIPDPEDRRAKLICLTEKGREAQATGLAILLEIEARWIERYGAERWAAMRDLLEEIVAAEAPDAVPELASPELAGLAKVA